MIDYAKYNETNNVLISIIVPAYNCEQYIERCINSLLAQSYHNVEIIIVDNASSDHTKELCMEMQKKDNRIILAEEPKKGVSSARNHGLDLASGELVFFVDADDWLSPDCLEVLMGNLELCDDIICSDLYEEYEGEKIERRSFLRPETDLNLLEPTQKLHAVEEKYLFTSIVTAALFRRSLIGEHRFPQLAYAEDSVFFRSLFFEDVSAKYIRFSGYHYFINKDSVTVNKKNRRLEHSLGCLECAFLTWEYSCNQQYVSEQINRGLIGSAKYYVKETLKAFRFGDRRTRSMVRTTVNEMLKRRLPMDCKLLLGSFPMLFVAAVDSFKVKAQKTNLVRKRKA